MILLIKHAFGTNETDINKSQDDLFVSIMS